MVPALSLEQSARRMGAYRWIEERLFEALGAWSALVPEPEVKARLAAEAREHAWHAELWHERLPTAGDMTPDGLTEPASGAVATLATALVDSEAEHQTIEKLVGTYRVLLPRLITDYSEHLGATSALSDGPIVRALRLALRDELEAWSRGEALVQSLLRSEEQVVRAAERQARLESILAGKRGLAGPLRGEDGDDDLDSGGKVTGSLSTPGGMWPPADRV